MVIDEKPNRKHERFKHWDYSRNGGYFVTICTQDREQILGYVVGAENVPPEMNLSKIGKCVESCIAKIPEHYPDVFVDKYAIMPNHIHLLS